MQMSQNLMTLACLRPSTGSDPVATLTSCWQNAAIGRNQKWQLRLAKEEQDRFPPKTPFFHMITPQVIRFRFLSSIGPPSSSFSCSAVSAGLSKECTLLAMLLRLVAGAECSSKFGRGNFETPTPHDTLPTPKPADTVGSLCDGAIGSWSAAVMVVRRDPFI